MKLHTDFHDYYDNAVGYGIDDKVHYNRFTKEVEQVIEAKADLPKYIGGTPLLLGFCGEIIPVIENKEYNEKREVINLHYSYSYEEFFDYSLSVSYNATKQKLWWLRVKQTEKEIKKQLTKDLIKIGAKRFFIDWKSQNDSLFLQHQVPIWILNLQDYSQKITLNPHLETYKFNRIKDSFTAFQEISMYLSNILVEQKEIVKIEDKYRIEQHGFDLKTSFRKEKKK
jgi:hypothetical protein